MSYYTVTGNPADQSRGTSPSIRAEFALIAAGFNLLPIPAAINGGAANFVVDSGAANAYSVTPSTTISALFDGLTLLVKFANASTAGSTITLTGVTGGGSVPLVRPDGTALQTGDILAGQILPISYSATMAKFQLSTSSASAVAAAAASANSAASSASAAATSATSAQNYAQGLNGTSATSTAIGTGSKTFTASNGKQWAAGSFLQLASAANNANFMYGQCTAYNSGTGALTVNVLQTGGSGTFADWVVSLSAAMPSAATSSDIVNQAPNSGTTGGTSTAYTLTPAVPIAAYAAKQTFWVTFNAASGDQPTLQISGVASPPNLVYQAPDGSYANIRANQITAGHSSRVTLLSTTQAVVERLPVTPSAAQFQTNTFAANFTVAWADAGQLKTHTSATPHTISIPDNATTALPIGFTLTVFNDAGAGNVSIATSADTLLWLGSGSTGARTLAANGMATVTKVSATKWAISGANLT